MNMQSSDRYRIAVLAAVILAIVWGGWYIVPVFRAGFNLADAGKQVIYIETEKTVKNEKGESKKGRVIGSGYLAWTDGERAYAITNDHVVGGADIIRLRFKGEKKFRSAKVHSRDPVFDLAVVVFDLDSGGEERLGLRMGDSSKMSIFDRVFAIGNPIGIEFIPARGEIVNIRYMPEKVFFADLTINPGNSGGPAFNGLGEVIGVVEAMTNSPSPLGIIIPTQTIQGIWQKLQAGGMINHGMLGMTYEDAWKITDKEWQNKLHVFGQDEVVVTSVAPGFPAQAADVRLGDVLLGFGRSADGEMTAFRSRDEFYYDMNLHFFADDDMALWIRRGGDIMIKKITLVRMQEESSADEEEYPEK